MKKILRIVVVVLFFLSGFRAIAINHNIPGEKEFVEQFEMVSIDFFPPIVKEADVEFVEISREGANSLLAEPGKPILPMVIKIFDD